MKRGRRVGLGLLAVAVAGFLGLWVAGPRPLTMGPYVQNVTVTTADVCWFDAEPRALEVTIDVGGPEPRRIVESGAVSAHRIHVGGLAPGRRFAYRVLDAVTRAELGAGSFKTPPATGDTPFTFAAVGDSGRVPRWLPLRRFGFERIEGAFPRTGQWDVAAWIAAQQPDFFVHLGDVIYSHDQLPAYQEAFFRPFAAQLRQGAVAVTLGNHDMHRWEHPEFFRIFHTPQRLEPARRYADFSHTFVWAGVRFLVLDVFWAKWAPGSPELRWLDETLRANRRPCTIVIMHQPAFTDEAGATENASIQKNIWPTLAQYGVALVISGDSHNYQRFRPIDGITQVIVGTGGKSIRPVAARRLAHAEEQFGFLLVRVAGRRITGEFRTGAAAPLDTFTIE